MKVARPLVAAGLAAILSLAGLASAAPASAAAKAEWTARITAVDCDNQAYFPPMSDDSEPGCRLDVVIRVLAADMEIEADEYTYMTLTPTVGDVKYEETYSWDYKLVKSDGHTWYDVTGDFVVPVAAVENGRLLLNTWNRHPKHDNHQACLRAEREFAGTLTQKPTALTLQWYTATKTVTDTVETDTAVQSKATAKRSATAKYTAVVVVGSRFYRATAKATRSAKASARGGYFNASASATRTATGSGYTQSDADDDAGLNAYGAAGKAAEKAAFSKAKALAKKDASKYAAKAAKVKAKTLAKKAAKAKAIKLAKAKAKRG